MQIIFNLAKENAINFSSASVNLGTPTSKGIFPLMLRSPLRDGAASYNTTAKKSANHKHGSIYIDDTF